MHATWHTAWKHQDIVVYRNDVEMDRIAADEIERVVFVHRGDGESPGDLVYAVLDTTQDSLVFPADTGFAGRVNFERQAFWQERNCIYWVPASSHTLRLQHGQGGWLRWPFSRPQFLRVSGHGLRDLMAQWPLEGPQTWEQRKWCRIERRRPFSQRGLQA